MGGWLIARSFGSAVIRQLIIQDRSRGEVGVVARLLDLFRSHARWLRVSRCTLPEGLFLYYSYIIKGEPMGVDMSGAFVQHGLHGFRIIRYRWPSRRRLRPPRSSGASK